MTNVEKAAWELAQLIYWTIEHPNPRNALLLLDDWPKIRAEAEAKDAAGIDPDT